MAWGWRMSGPDRFRRQMLRSGGLLLLAGTGLPGCANVKVNQSVSQDEKWLPDAAFLADLPRLMRTCHVPGIAMACLHQGELVWSFQVGVTNAETGTPVTAESIFEVASLSKPVFAWLLLRLVDEQCLELDQPLVSLLRPDWLADDPLNDRITARHVLSHTTGFVNWRKQPMQEKLQPAFVPGSKLSYSGEAYFWLQLVVEQVMNASLDTLAQRYVFAPLGMTDSSFAWDEAQAARSVYGHSAPDAGALIPLPVQGFRSRWQLAAPLASTWHKPLSQWRWPAAERAYAALADAVPTNEVSWPGDLMANCAASLRCTAADYARFLRVLMAQSATPKLTSGSQSLYTEPQFETRPEWSSKTLGWNCEQTRQGPLLYHGGNNANQFKAFALAERATGRALVVLTNGGGGATVYHQIVRASTGRDLLAFEP